MQAMSFVMHVPLVCFGIAFPLITVFTERRRCKRGDAAVTELAPTWTKTMGAPFAAGAVPDTLVSFG